MMKDLALCSSKQAKDVEHNRFFYMKSNDKYLSATTTILFIISRRYEKLTPVQYSW